MPSGLTCNIYDETDMSLRGFALKCVTQLGAGYHVTNQGEKRMPLDKAPVIPVSDWHLKQLAKAKEEVKHWIDVENNPEELDRLYNEYLEKREQDEKGYNAGKTELKARYVYMKAKVEAWDLPEAYSSLKELMLKQLDESIDFDCKTYPMYSSPAPSKEEWLNTMLSCACRDVEYHTKEYKEEVDRVKENNDYLQGLYDELDKIEPLIQSLSKTATEEEQKVLNKKEDNH